MTAWCAGTRTEHGRPHHLDAEPVADCAWTVIDDNLPVVQHAETFVARVAGTSEECGVLTTGVSEHADGSGASLLFMSPLPGDTDTTISVCNEHGAAANGGVTELRLGHATLRVLFAPGVGVGLGYSDDTLIALDLQPQQRADLRAGLVAVAERCSEPPRVVFDV